MSNLAGKAYAMSLVTPVRRHIAPLNKVIFWALGTFLFRPKLKGLLTLSMIHYARWVIVKGHEFPRLSKSQPRENLRYCYMFFFSNFNGSWAQYIDSFSAAIPKGLNMLWWRNVGWPKSVPEQPFHRYVEHNQVWNDYYYSAYPMAASNDVKAAERVCTALEQLADAVEVTSASSFQRQYNATLRDLQGDLAPMGPAPVPSLASEAVERRRSI